MNEAKSDLILEAQKLMRRSRDPIHDFAHVGRVVVHAGNIAERMNICENDREAILLAAWWHDVARTITKKPSLVWMALIDDVISACMFWYKARKYHNDSTVRLATVLMLAKSLGTGSLFAYLLPKEKRHLVDIVKDADMLDVLHQDRVRDAMNLVASSFVYKIAYKRSINWFIIKANISMRTAAAREYFKEMLDSLLAWIKKQAIFIWHVEQFGRAWVEKIIRECEHMLRVLTEYSVHA